MYDNCLEPLFPSNLSNLLYREAPSPPNYKMNNLLGSGAFGAVYEATDRDHRKLAIKVQEIHPHCPPLSKELNIYKKLFLDRSGLPTVGIPLVYDYFQDQSNEFLVMQQMGVSVADIQGQDFFSKKDTLMLGIQALRRLETLHRHGVLHRDIKPANIVMGLPPHERTLHFIDFGLARVVDDWASYDYDAYEPYFAGSEYFAPVEALFKKPPTRVGDVQALAYVLLAMVVGKLPWERYDQDTGRELTYGELGIQRLRWKPVDLCEGFPELTQFMKIVMRMKKRETPAYDNLVALLEHALDSMYCENDGQFDWLVHDNLEDMHEVQGPGFDNLREIGPNAWLPFPSFDISLATKSAALRWSDWDQLVSMTGAPKPKKPVSQLFPAGSYACGTEFRRNECVASRLGDWHGELWFKSYEVTMRCETEDEVVQEASLCTAEGNSGTDKNGPRRCEREFHHHSIGREEDGDEPLRPEYDCPRRESISPDLVSFDEPNSQGGWRSEPQLRRR